jgi:hypothetical protein
MKNLISLLLLMFIVNLGFAQYTYDDVTLPKDFKIEETALTLNGGGLREKYFLDLYVGGLYLAASSSDADEIIKADKPMSIKLHIISGLINSEKMIAAVDEGMEKSTKGNSDQFAEKIGFFKETFSEEIQLNDIYDIAYLPAKGLLIYKNNKLIKTIPGLDFKQALFGIWFCDDPADDDLKEGMLGK